MSTTFIVLMTLAALVNILMTSFIIYSIIDGLLRNLAEPKETMLGTFAATIWAAATINAYIFYFVQLYT